MNLPQISQQTRQNLKRQGFVNRTYENLKLHSCFQPRTFAYNLYTYTVMAASGIGYLIAKRGGYSTLALGVAFIAAPTLSLLQRRQLDFYECTSNAIIHPKQLAEQFPVLYQQYQKVLNQVQDEIKVQKQILRGLENEN